MKTFKHYLTEGKKTYAFKIKVAGDLPEDCDQQLKAYLEKYNVASMSKGKRTPIQDVPLDFPGLKNKSVTIWNLEIHYPTTSEVLENYISQCCGYPLSCVKVVTDNAPSEEYQKIVNKKESSNEEESGQIIVGEKHTMSLLKDLIKDRTETKEYTGVNDEILAKSAHSEKASEMPEVSTTSPIGSKGK